MIFRIDHKARCIAFVLLLLFATPTHAQDPALARDDLKYSKVIFEKNHLTAQVELEIGQDKYIRFQYEHYPDLDKIVTAEGEQYSRSKGQGWLKINDFWKTSGPVKHQKANALDTYVKIVQLPFADSTLTHPETKGKKRVAEVWKFVGRKDLFVCDSFTYEKSTENPNPEGAFPHYTFIKYNHDKDGNLILTNLEGPMTDGVNVIPLSITYQLLFLPPSNKIKIATVPPQPLQSGS